MFCKKNKNTESFNLCKIIKIIKFDSQILLMLFMLFTLVYDWRRKEPKCIHKNPIILPAVSYIFKSYLTESLLFMLYRVITQPMESKENPVIIICSPVVVENARHAALHTCTHVKFLCQSWVRYECSFFI